MRKMKLHDPFTVLLADLVMFFIVDEFHRRKKYGKVSQSYSHSALLLEIPSTVVDNAKGFGNTLKSICETCSSELLIFSENPNCTKAKDL